MNEEKEKQKKERRFSQEQYDMLKRCSKKRDMTEWNEWRKENPAKAVFLEGAELFGFYLKGAWLCAGSLYIDAEKRWLRLNKVYLQAAHLWDADLEDTKFGNADLHGADLGRANLQRADLCGANLEGAEFMKANLEGADLEGANLKKAYLEVANLKNANLTRAVLEEAYLNDANMENVKLGLKQLSARCADTSCGVSISDIEEVGPDSANLKNAELEYTNLENAWLKEAYLQGCCLARANLKRANLEGCHLERAELKGAIVDGGTSFWKCKVDRDTNFIGVGIDSTRIDPGTKQLLEYNIRRKNWEDWYKEYPILAWLVKPFWWMSDYGMSTARVIIWFFVLAFLFAAVYMNWAYWAPPGIVSNLIVQPEVGEAVLHYFGRALIRPVYFSIVTMTTLGFGDMYANKGSIAGHVILAVQVILGYVLLGALITRFAVLFTAGGPAGRFSKEK